MHAAVALALVALAPAAVAPPPPPPAPEPPRGGQESVEAVVKRCVAAYGGNGGLARAAVRREEGSVTSLLHPGDVGRIARAYARPGKLRVEISYPGGGGEVRVLDGGRGWRDGEAAAGPRLDAMVLQAARLDLPALLSVPGARIQDRGSAEVSGTPVRVLAVEPAPGLTVEAHVDATGRILRSRGSTGGPLTPVAFETTYGDFRKVDGVLVAFHEWNWANGKTTGETVLEKIEFPRTLPPQTFAP